MRPLNPESQQERNNTMACENRISLIVCLTYLFSFAPQGALAQNTYWMGVPSSQNNRVYEFNTQVPNDFAEIIKRSDPKAPLADAYSAEVNGKNYKFYTNVVGWHGKLDKAISYVKPGGIGETWVNVKDSPEWGVCKNALSSFDLPFHANNPGSGWRKVSPQIVETNGTSAPGVKLIIHNFTGPNTSDGPHLSQLVRGNKLCIACNDGQSNQVHIYEFDHQNLKQVGRVNGLGALGGFAADANNSLYVLTGKKNDSHPNTGGNIWNVNDRNTKLYKKRPGVLSIAKVGAPAWTVDLNATDKYVHKGWQVKKPIYWGGASLVCGGDQLFGVFSREHMTGTSGSSAFALNHKTRQPLQRIGHGKDHCFGTRTLYDASEQAFITLELHDHEPTLGMLRWKTGTDKENLHDDYRVVYHRPNNSNATYTEIGGLELGANGYLVLFSSWNAQQAPHSDRNARHNARSLGAVHVSKDFYKQPKNFEGWDADGTYKYHFDPKIVNSQNEASKGVSWLVPHQGRGKVAASIERPKLVKLNQDYYALWEEHSYLNGKSTYTKTWAMQLKLQSSGNSVTIQAGRKFDLGNSARLYVHDDPVNWGNTVNWATPVAGFLRFHRFDPAATPSYTTRLVALPTP